MFEYKVVPAPSRASKVKGLKTPADRFAHMLSAAINAEANGGWQYVRSETLTCEERSLLGRVQTSTQTVLIFARPLVPASAQDDGYGYDTADSGYEQGYAAQDYAQQGYDDAGAGDAHHPTAHHPDASDPFAQDYAPEPPAAAPTPAPALAPTPAPTPQRQEPLFRSGAMLHGDARGGRAEPTLRPRDEP